jgi:hypothetical protein
MFKFVVVCPELGRRPERANDYGHSGWTGISTEIFTSDPKKANWELGCFPYLFAE